MKKMLISEDEKSRILNLHQNLGYKTSLNEQGTPQQPQPNVQKPTETLGNYFTYDPIGKKIASISPSFAKWSTSNNIDPKAAKYQVEPNNIQLSAVGANGQEYSLYLNQFEASKGNIPQDTYQKMVDARNVLRTKIKELDARGAGTLKCFNLDMVRKNDIKNGDTLRACKQYFNEYDTLANSTDLNYWEKMNQFLQFASVAPKYKPKQG